MNSIRALSSWQTLPDRAIPALVIPCIVLVATIAIYRFSCRSVERPLNLTARDLTQNPQILWRLPLRDDLFFFCTHFFSQSPPSHSSPEIDATRESIRKSLLALVNQRQNALIYAQKNEPPLEKRLLEPQTADHYLKVLNDLKQTLDTTCRCLLKA